MAYTQADLDRIKRAISSGTLSVEIEGKRVTYRTMADLERAKAMIEDDLLATSGKQPIRRTFATYTSK